MERVEKFIANEEALGAGKGGKRGALSLGGHYCEELLLARAARLI